jgi:hypothetical protein
MQGLPVDVFRGTLFCVLIECGGAIEMDVGGHQLNPAKIPQAPNYE